MRRYTILATALFAIFATSCAVAEGNMERQPIDVGKAIAREANARLESVSSDICWALAADKYLTTDDERLREDIYQNVFRGYLTPRINEGRDTVSLVNSNGATYYTYTTDGRLLSEGGKWQSWYEGNIIEATESGVIEVRSYENMNEYSLDILNWAAERNIDFELSGSVAFYYNSEGSKKLSIEIDDTIHYTSKLRNNRYGNRAIGLYDGNLNVVYSDTWAGYNDEVKLTYGEQTEESVKVEYMDQTGSFEK